MNYKNFEDIKTIGNLNEVYDKEDGWTPFHYICRDNSSNLEVIKYSVENGSDLNTKSIYGSTPFHCICYNKTTKEVLEYCLEHGAVFNIKNVYSNTPFHWICCNKSTKELLEYCLNNGADLTIVNNNGYTPFDYLKQYNPSLVPFVEEWLERKQNVIKQKVTIPKVIIGCIYKFLKR